jgi:hypothetical protein
VLVQFALIVFALCGLLSAVIDIGYARLTQGQMQSAADAAALEGLRHRDVGIRNPVTNQVVNDPFASDCLRRAAANRIVRRTFDDDFDPANGDPGYQFGAGPVVNMTEGVTSAHALQTVSVPGTHVYKPDPQLNQQNVVYGDMVSGRFCYTADPVPSEGGSYELQDIVCTEPQRGTGIYSRNDFNPNLTSPVGPAALNDCPAPDDAPPAPWPTGGTGSLGTVDDSAFLVRLRRSNEFQDLGGQAEANVGSSGPSLPLTFGKGTTIHGDTPGSDYSVRRDGLTVRATAISQVRPALHLGVPVTAPVAISTPLMTPFALLDTCAQTPANAPATAPVTIAVTVNPVTGAITRAAGAASPGCPANAVVGRFVANAATFRNVGMAVPVANVAAPCATTTSFTGRYGSVYSVMTAGPTRVIGFSRVDFTRVATCPTGANAATAPYTATITRQPSIVASSNATAVLSGGFAAAIPAALVGELIEKNLGRTGVNYGPVLVAVLAR